MMALNIKVTDKTSLIQYLSSMRPGDTLSGLQFTIVDKNGNAIDLSNTTILCRKRYSTKKIKKNNPLDYRFEVFKNNKLGSGTFGEVFPIIATLKQHNKQIKLLKKENGKQRVVKVETEFPTKKSLAKNEAAVGVEFPYLHMKPVAKGKQNKNYIVMRRMPGATLFDLLIKGRLHNLTKTSQFLLFLRLLEALHALHQQGFVHRDIKTDNIMMDFSLENTPLQANIIDVGFCCRVEGNSAAFLSDVFFMGQVFSDIVKFAIINDFVLDQLIKKMTDKLDQRISLEKAILEVQACYLREYDQLRLAHLQLPLLVQLSHNKVFFNLLKTHLANKRLAHETQCIADSEAAKEHYFSDVNHSINLFAVLTAFKNSQHRKLGSVLIDSFFLALTLANQEKDDNLNTLRQSIVQAIFCYVQKNYQSDSQARCASERRINNIKTLLNLLENTATKEALHSTIINWNKSIERGWLNNSELFKQVAKAAGLEKPIVNPYSFWSRIYFGSLPRLNNNSLLSKLRPSV
jgi:serine/threonine protein kinase